MGKKAFLRSLLGAPLGLAIGYLITIIISLIAGKGAYLAVATMLEQAVGSELKAVAIQAVVVTLYGMMWAGTSVFWEMENWSILRQTITHLLVASLTTLPIAYFMGWMDRSLKGFLVYFGIFFAIYLVIWLSQYSAMKKRVGQINAKVKENNLSSK